MSVDFQTILFLQGFSHKFFFTKFFFKISIIKTTDLKVLVVERHEPLFRIQPVHVISQRLGVLISKQQQRIIVIWWLTPLLVMC